MRLLAFTDTHEDPRIFDRFRKVIVEERVDLAVCAGDFTVFGRKTERMLAGLDSLGVPVVLIHGNHEDPDEIERLLPKFPNLRWAHGRFIEVGSLTFFGWGGGGMSERDSDLEELEERLPARFDERTIVVTHGPPAGTALDEVSPGWHVGSESVADLVRRRRPMLLLCGHIHECFHIHDRLVGTILINPGHDGEIIEVDDD